MKIKKGDKVKVLQHGLSPYLIIGEKCIVEEVDSTYRVRPIKRPELTQWVNAEDIKKEPSKKDLLKRIEALEKRLQPCETSNKFKAIADHANAINDIIKSAPE